MNKSLPWTRINNKITVILPNGQPKTVTDEKKELFDKVLECIKLGEWDKIPDLMDVKAAISTFSNGNFEVVNGIVQVQGKPVPNGLSKKIIAFAKEGLPFQPLLKFWDKLNRNPSNRNVQGLFEFLEIKGYAITEDGDFIAYKGIRDDWTDNYSGKISNKIGETVKVPRNEVSDDPQVECSFGLHVADYTFASSYSHGGHMIMVSVNPEHVVSMPDAYHFTKMRVCEYTIISEVTKEEKGNLYKAPVDNSSDDEYKEYDSQCEICSCDDSEEDFEDETCECDKYNCAEYNSHHEDCACQIDEISCIIF